MSSARGLCGAIVGGACGAAAWVGLEYFAGLGFGLLAWAVGGLAGLGMALGTSMRGGRGAGVLAALVAGLAVIAGKFGVARVGAERRISETVGALTVEDARDHMASQIALEFEDVGRDQGDFGEDDGGFGSAVVVARDEQWNAMTPSERSEYVQAFKARARSESVEAGGVLTVMGFIFSFGPSGLLGLGLGVGSAYTLGGRRAGPVEEPVEIVEQGAQAPAIFRALPKEALAAAADSAQAEQAPPAPAPAVESSPASLRMPAAAEKAAGAEAGSGTGLGAWAFVGRETQSKTVYQGPRRKAA